MDPRISLAFGIEFEYQTKTIDTLVMYVIIIKFENFDYTIYTYWWKNR